LQTNPSDLLTEQSAADHVNLAAGTLRQWRYLGQGPAYIKLNGGRIRYRRRDLDAWLDAQTVRPAS
jgi:hypothetical protein